MSKILQIKNLSYSVDNATIPLFKYRKINILSDISFDVDENEILGIAGESGSGKTTLAKLLCGILTQYKGEIIFSSEQLPANKVNFIQLLFQNNGEILNPSRKIDDIISEVIHLRIKEETALKAEKFKILESVNLPINILERTGSELSGGQQQRVALARLLAARPKILILDEPFSSQDAESQTNFVELFKKLKSTFGITIICISHNLTGLKNICDRIIIMQKGEILENNSAFEIYNNPKHNYTKLLLRASKYTLSYNEFIKLKE
jgi:peptide/nickel transport system ATP-binding protein